MDKIMLNSGELLSRRHGCAYCHFLIYLTRVAGDYRGTISERSLDAVVGLSYSCGAQYDKQFLHRSSRRFAPQDDRLVLLVVAVDFLCVVVLFFLVIEILVVVEVFVIRILLLVVRKVFEGHIAILELDRVRSL